MKNCIFILCAIILSGCSHPQYMTKLDMLQLMVEIDQRDQSGMKPDEKSDLLRGQLALEQVRTKIHRAYYNVQLDAYEKCQSDFRDLQMENAGIRAANELMNKRLLGIKYVR